MSIPLDRLYHYIKSTAEQIHQDRVIIYRFFPYGSKKLEDLKSLHAISTKDMFTMLPIYCNDQEPLNYQFYNEASANLDSIPDDVNFQYILKKESLYIPRGLKLDPNIHDYAILLHSEKRSSNVIDYQNDRFITAYYWSHALLALDWFRYAAHVTQRKQINKTFLIYNRAWSGTREYRLKFAETLTQLGLDTRCQMSINPIEPELGIHYNSHTFSNPVWRPDVVLENFFPISNAPSHYSADFDIEDYEATDIEVVLETLFDDSRLHLTEKSLRPIACAQPFILAGTHGSLEYLRSYGFKTFGAIWDESYDLVEDPEERLIRIADLMRSIANWTPRVREQKMVEAQAIAEHNRQHFFSEDFFKIVTEELTKNLSNAIEVLSDTNTYQNFLIRTKQILNNPNITNYLENSKILVSPSQFTEIMELVENHYIPRLSLLKNK